MNINYFHFFCIKNSEKLPKTVVRRHSRITIKKGDSNSDLFYKLFNFRVLDSMNDFILTILIEISIKSYMDSVFPRSGQKISLK